MKTTNYETSKKLAEIGFEADTSFYWQAYYIDTIDNSKCIWHLRYADGLQYPQPKYDVIVPGDDHLKEAYRAYDLETILNILPKSIINEDLCFAIYPLVMGYFSVNAARKAHGAKEILDSFADLSINEINLVIRKDETLATAAAKLLIKLHEEGIINLEQTINQTK